MAIPQKLTSTVTIKIDDAHMLSWSNLLVVLKQGDTFYGEYTPVAISNTECAFDVPEADAANINAQKAIEWQFLATDANGKSVYTKASAVAADRVIKDGVY